jgi:uncharacterized protein YggE
MKASWLNPIGARLFEAEWHKGRGFDASKLATCSTQELRDAVQKQSNKAKQMAASFGVGRRHAVSIQR